MPTSLVAGPELDAAVAKACGIPHYGFDSDWDWHPSTDLNAAFEAASACPGVDGIHVERTKTLEWYANIGGSIAYAETPAMAICNAILALTARPSSSGSPSS